MRNDTKDGGIKGTLDIVNGFHAGVEILDEECQPHTQNQADHNPKCDVQGNVRPNRLDGQIRIVGDFHGGFLGQRQVHFLLHDPEQDGVTNARGVGELPLGVEVFPSLLPHIGFPFFCIRDITLQLLHLGLG